MQRENNSDHHKKCYYMIIPLKGIWVSLRFENRLNFTINPRKLSIVYWCVKKRSEDIIVDRE